MKAKNAIDVPKAHFISMLHGQGSNNLINRNRPDFRRNQRPPPVVKGVQRNQQLTVPEKMLYLATNVDSNTGQVRQPILGSAYEMHLYHPMSRSGQHHINANSNSGNTEDFARRVEPDFTSNCKLATMRREQFTDCRV